MWSCIIRNADLWAGDKQQQGLEVAFLKTNPWLVNDRIHNFMAYDRFQMFFFQKIDHPSATVDALNPANQMSVLKKMSVNNADSPSHI